MFYALPFERESLASHQLECEVKLLNENELRPKGSESCLYYDIEKNSKQKIGL